LTAHWAGIRARFDPRLDTSKVIVVFIVTFELYNFVCRVIRDIADNASRVVFSDGFSLFPDLLFNRAEIDLFKVL